MAKKNNLDMVGKWAFIIGLALAILAGLLEVAGVYTVPQLALILVILGLIVGFLNIAEKDTVKLLVAIIALNAIGAAAIAAIPSINAYLAAMLMNIIALAGAAGLVVAVKAIYETGRR
jgi:hypothetical protein